MPKHPDFPNSKKFLPIEQAVMIKCRYCEIADICHRREQKEAYEKAGVITRCVITPNRPGKKRKEKRRRQRKKK
jgi:hypothetical protein